MVVKTSILVVFRRFWKALPLPLGWQCALQAHFSQVRPFASSVSMESNSKHVVAYLSQLGLQQYFNKFLDAGFDDFETLLNAKDIDFQELGGGFQACPPKGPKSFGFHNLSKVSGPPSLRISRFSIFFERLCPTWGSYLSILNFTFFSFSRKERKNTNNSR